MSKSAKNTSKSASKSKIDLCQHGVNAKFCKKCEHEAIGAMVEGIKKALPRPGSKEDKALDKAEKVKHDALQHSGDFCVVNEAIGLHARIAKVALDNGEQAPEEGDLVMAVVDGQYIPLLVRTSQGCVNGDQFLQCFLCERGSGHHLVLQAVKGQRKAQLFWK